MERCPKCGEQFFQSTNNRHKPNGVVCLTNQVVALKNANGCTDVVALAIAAAKANEHCAELRDAWQRGSIREYDSLGMTGQRANRNVEVEIALRMALAQPSILVLLPRPHEEVGNADK
jgi:hypothetical protein